MIKWIRHLNYLSKYQIGFIKLDRCVLFEGTSTSRVNKALVSKGLPLKPYWFQFWGQCSWGRERILSLCLPLHKSLEDLIISKAFHYQSNTNHLYIYTYTLTYLSECVWVCSCNSLYRYIFACLVNKFI